MPALRLPSSIRSARLMIEQPCGKQTMPKEPIWITRAMIERAALALYREAGWDRPWHSITRSGRARFRKAALTTIIAAIPIAARKIGK